MIKKSHRRAAGRPHWFLARIALNAVRLAAYRRARWNENQHSNVGRLGGRHIVVAAEQRADTACPRRRGVNVIYDVDKTDFQAILIFHGGNGRTLFRDGREIVLKIDRIVCA